MNSFFEDNWQFINYSTEHHLSNFIFLLIGIYLVWLNRAHFSQKQRDQLIFWYAILIWVSQVGKCLIRYYLGNFNHATDLPLELCNLLTFIMPIVILRKSKFWWSIIFFWIMAGTFQALITPTLRQSFPNYEYWRYFLVHAGLVTCALYPVFNWSWTVTWKDAIRSGIGLNIIAFTMYCVNNLIGANYMYMNGKPPGKTLYSILGEWPIYILQLEFVLLGLFSIILVPFLIKRLK